MDMKEPLLTTAEQDQGDGDTPSLGLHSWRQQMGASKDDFCYIFNDYDTFMLACLSKRTSDQIIWLLNRNASHATTILTILIWLPLRVMAETGEERFFHIYSYYVCTMTVCFWMPIITLWILSTNRRAFKLAARTFEFGFKCVSAAAFAILNLIYWYKSYPKNEKHLELASFAAFNINIVGMIVLVSSFDALNISKKYKIIFSAMCGFICAYFSFYYEFLIPQQQDFVIVVPMYWIQRDFSFLSWQAETLRILAIFLFKQSFLTYYRTHKCVLIRYTPYLKWIHNEHLEQAKLVYSVDLTELKQ
mmetsp:Transcript_41991/g.67508  ORF Transcript_41991/g.67508 Transcript_41991/m.67508 type:complete len:304 (-) Transcript_41991:93-1004(-)